MSVHHSCPERGRKSGVSSSFLPGKRRKSGVSSSFLPGKRRKSGVSSSFLPGKRRKSGVSSSFLPGKRRKSGVSSSFLPGKEEIRCQFIILVRKGEPTPDYLACRYGRVVGGHGLSERLGRPLGANTSVAGEQQA